MTDRLDDQEDGFAYLDEDIADKEWWEQDGLHEYDPSDRDATHDEADLIEPDPDEWWDDRGGWL